PLRTFLDQAPLERSAKIQHGPAVERLPPEEDGLLDEPPRDHVDRPSDIALDHVAAAVRGGDRAAGGAQIDADVEDIGLLRHLLAPWAWPSVATRLRESAYAWMPRKRARAMPWR